MIGAGWRFAAECLGWAVAVVWCVRTRTLIQRLGEIPDLSEEPWDLCPTRAPGLIVAVPARDEAATIGPAMGTLLAQDYRWLRIVAVDDRSTDGTGALLDQLSAAHPDRLDVVHLTETPEDWIAKTFALELVTARSRSAYLLFTDADVWLSPSILRRALAYAELTDADHVVIAPTPVTTTWGERAVLGFLQIMSLWVSRPWRVADPTARWDVAAAGACSLVRREAIDELGGWAPQRLAIAGNITLGRRVRAAGMRQRFVFAPGLVLVHCAPGAWGVIRWLSRDLFALMNFRLWLLVLTMSALVAVFILPLAGLFWWPTILPGLLVVACIAVAYRMTAEINGIPARYGWLYPLGVAAVLWATVRSVLLTWWRRGVLWRGTLYPLNEVRGHNSPFTWEWQAAKLRAENIKAERVARPSRWLRAVNGLRRRPARAPGRGPGHNGAPRSRRG